MISIGCPSFEQRPSSARPLPALGRVSAPLLAQRWEEGWDRPLADWREQLGVTALVERSPFSSETPRA